MTRYGMSKEEFEVKTEELRLQYEAGRLDGEQDGRESYVSERIRTDSVGHSDVKSVDKNLLGLGKDDGSCFYMLCRAAGYAVHRDLHAVGEMDASRVASMAKLDQFKVFFVAYAEDDQRNHIELVPSSSANARTRIVSLSGGPVEYRTVVCTTMQHFFNKSNEWANYKFYADQGFGGDTTSYSQGQTSRTKPPRAESVAGDSVYGGRFNVSSGVTRAKRRVVSSKTSALSGAVAKNYRTTNAIMFNNADEMFQDKISREHAQEIIEELFEVWGVPLDQPEAAKYAEDLLWSFLITVTASNKADYNRLFDIPVNPVTRDGSLVSSVDADFSKLSLLLESKYGVTRRQFARGVADDLRAFLRHDENQAILPQLASRVGCESLMAYLAFDGSTHCSNMTTREVTFTKTLESRNLFERDDVVAQGASDKLMQGLSGGVRSVAPR